MTSSYSLVFFDVDSTVVTIEGIDVLAGGRPDITALTEAAMTGALPIEEVYARRLEIIRPPRSAVEELSRLYVDSLVEGAEEVIRRLREANIDIHLITAGVEQAVAPLSRELGLEPRALHAVPLRFDRRGRYRDFDRRSLLTRARGKETVVLDVRARSHGRAMFVGDGATDLEVKDAVDLFVGFGGVRVRERVRQQADVFIEKLIDILPLVFDTQPLRRLKRNR